MKWSDIFKNWDAIRATSRCLHCRGSGVAPGDGRTECGFCEKSLDGRVREGVK